MAGDTFIMNGRSVQVEPSSKTSHRGKHGTVSQGNLTVRDLTSGQISVYADGLTLTLREGGTLKSILNDYPSITLQYAPGVYAYVKVPRDQLATLFNALNADPRVAAVHLRPMTVKTKLR